MQSVAVRVAGQMLHHAVIAENVKDTLPPPFRKQHIVKVNTCIER